MNLENIPTLQESLAWDEALKIADAFMPEARKIYKIETGKACNNFAMRMAIAKFYMKLKEQP